MNWKRWMATGVAAATIVTLLSWLSLKGHALAPTTQVARARSSSGNPVSKLEAPESHKVARESQATPEASWARKFHSASDYFAFVSTAIPAALKGDGRAAYYIGNALSACAPITNHYRGVADPEAKLSAELAEHPKAPQWTRDLRAQLMHRCLGLAQRDAFAGLPTGQNYNANYWYDSALSNGDALAEVRSASRELADVAVSATMTDDIKSKKIQSAESVLKTAIASGDADAMFDVGMAIASSRLSADPTQGVAIALAACELGYDCSADNPDNVFSNCKRSGACPADTDFAYFMQQSLGADKYAQAYARAQTVKQSIEAGDWAAVTANVKIGGHP